MRLLTSRMLSGAVAALALTLATAAPGVAQPRLGACRLSVLELAFGNYDVFEAGRTRATSRITVSCSDTTSKILPRIELSTGSSQDYASRTQVSGANVLAYNIYADQGLTQIAGDGSSGTTALFFSPIDGAVGGERTVHLYGAIEPRQFAPPGSYFDTVYVTLIF